MPHTLYLALSVISLLLIVVSVLPLLRGAQWWIRVWDYPRLQLAAALGTVALLQLSFAPASIVEIALLACTLAAFTRHIIRIFPYTKLHRVQALAGSEDVPPCSVSLLIANVLQSNRNAADLIKIVQQHRPDILIAVETDAWWDTELRLLDRDFPYAVRHPLGNTYGMILLSRLNLEETKVFDRVAENIPSIFAHIRLPSGGSFDLYAVHPEPPQPHNDTDERDAELLLVAREVSSRKRPAIVAGDLNDVAWSHSTRLFQRISGLLDPRVGRGLFATFHAEHRLARWPLDHVFHSKEFRVLQIEVLPYFGSDHFPIYVRLAYDPAAAEEQASPERADKKDYAKAREKISEVE